MDEMLSRFFQDMVSRVEGPLNLRLILQPLMATFFAIRDGMKDEQLFRIPYTFGLFTAKGHRLELFRKGWRSIGKVFILAIILDIVYQFKIGHAYPGEAVIVALLLAVVPYLLLRGTVNRIMSRIHHRGKMINHQTERQASR